MLSLYELGFYKTLKKRNNSLYRGHENVNSSYIFLVLKFFQFVNHIIIIISIKAETRIRIKEATVPTHSKIDWL